MASPLPLFRVTPRRLSIMAAWLAAHDVETKIPTIVGQFLKRRTKEAKRAGEFYLERAAKDALQEVTKLNKAKNMTRNEQYEELMKIVQRGLGDLLFDDFVKQVLKPAGLDRQANELRTDWEYKIAAVNL